MVNLGAGFYALEVSTWRRLESPWKRAGFSFEVMSPIGFARALVCRQRLPARVRIPGLDRALYEVYRQHEGRGAQEAVRQVKAVAQHFGQTMYRHRDWLLREGPVVLFVLEYLEHGQYWQAGIRYRGTDQAEELFRLEWLFPRCEVTQVDGEIVCFGRF